MQLVYEALQELNIRVGGDALILRLVCDEEAALLLLTKLGLLRVKPSEGE